MLLFTNEFFEQHDTGQHPEHAGRLRAIREELALSGVLHRCDSGQIRDATDEELQRVHPAGYVDSLRDIAAAGGGRLDPDTVCSPRSYAVARQAAGTACAAVDEVLGKQHLQALALLRPPGHHALADRAMGFCLFANAAIAAQQARHNHGLDRVLIVDWDVHHGNGTEAIFYEDSQVGFLSIHRYPFYPGTGAAEDTGSGTGLGTTWNVPIRFGTSRTEYMDHFQAGLEVAAERIRPQLVIVSAGFDAHRLDPVGSLQLESEDFVQLTRSVQEIARTHCQGRLVSLLEGGYHVAALAESVRLHVETLLSADKVG